MAVPFKVMSNGQRIPALGLGTWKSTPGEVLQAVKDAIDCGYRYIDGAFAYLNEAEVGIAIKEKIDEGVVKRDDLFIVSKLWNTFHRPEKVEECIKKTVTDLGLEQVDLYLLHWPFAYKEGPDVFPRDANGVIISSDEDYLDTWLAMEKLVEKGLTKSIGLSNFNKEQIERILAHCTIAPVNLQIECHPYLNQKKLIEFCKSKQITVTAYSPLGSPDRPWAKPDDPKLVDDSRLVTIAKKYNKSPAQIILKWLIQCDVIPIPKSVNKGRLLENISVFDFTLSDDDMKAVDSFHCNGRALSLDWIKDHKYYPFSAEF